MTSFPVSSLSVVILSVGMSVPELWSKIKELQEKLQYLKHLAKTKVIEQMKKYKQVSLFLHKPYFLIFRIALPHRLP